MGTTMSGPGPDRAPVSGSESSSLGRQTDLTWSMPKGMRRAVVFTEVGGLVLLELSCGSPLGDDTFSGGLKVPSRRWGDDARREPRRPRRQVRVGRGGS